MKFNSRLLISDLFAAGAAALFSAILIAGCASGERTGKFWDKADVKSSDAYVSAEMAKDRAVAANTPPGAGGKIAPASGTQDGPKGHAELPDFPGPPPAPPGAFGSDASATATSSSKTQAGVAVAGGDQTTSAAAGGAQTTDSASGTVVAPYVQKLAPSGVVDNSRHASEIVNPKSVIAKQLDPFAETDAEPSPASPSPAKRPAPPAAPVVSSAPFRAPTSAVAMPTTAHATLSNGNPFSDAESDWPPVGPTKPVISTNADSTQPQAKSLPPEPPAAPSVAASATVPAASADAFDVSAPPPPPLTPPTRATDSEGDPPTAAQSAPLPIATSKTASTASAPPPIATATPGRARSGVRLDDEALGEQQESPTNSPDQRVVQQAAKQNLHEAPAPAPASAYENDNRPTCAAPAAPERPANTSASPAPPQDTWESTKVSTPASPPSQRPLAAPVFVTIAPQAPPEAAPVPVSHFPQEPAPPTPAPPPVSATHAVDQAEHATTQKTRVEPPKTSANSAPMICDSASVRGRYVGENGPPPLATPQELHHEVLSPVPPRGTPCPAAGKTERTDPSIEGKSTSYWDDRFASPELKQTVSTADFLIPAAPGRLEVDEARSIAAGTSPLIERPASGNSAHDSGRPGSHAWFMIGMVAGLAASTVVWRRWRHKSEPQPG